MRNKFIDIVFWGWVSLIFFGLPISLTANLFFGENFNILHYIFFVTIVFVTSFSNIFDRKKDYTISLQFEKMVLCIAIAILAFANICRFEGLLSTEGQISNSPTDALYFSIVTWTTLGYGDFRPAENIRIWAALEALLGTIFLPLLFAGIIFILNKENEKNT